MRWYEQSRGGSLPSTSPLSEAQPPPQMPAKKLGRGKTQGKKEATKGFLSRKNKKADEELPVESTTSEKPSLSPTQSRTSSGKEKERSSEDNQFRALFALPANSIIPDPLAELPAWFHTDTEAWTTTSAATFRSRYPMHNPAGPRWYRNTHLYPPQENTPPTQFSTSFPPMPSAAERSQESTRMPGLSRTPSASPSPTPNSSQIRIMEPNGRVRTRKISQSDNVDMLDATDPWGMNWHHESPYDIGLNNERGGSPEAESPTDPRARRMSLSTGGSRHKTVIPSPLSQSTSAIHLSVSEPVPTQLTRGLSKKRKPFVGLFGHQSQDNIHVHPKSASAPPEGISPLSDDSVQRKVLRRKSAVVPTTVAPVSADTLQPEPAPKDKEKEKEKHSSFMGRFARRFSVMRKTSDNATTKPANGEATSPSDAQAETPAGAPAADQARRSIVNGARSPDPSKRVPPPSIEGDSAPQGATNGEATSGHRASISFSTDGTPALGKLTIANPDASTSLTASPVEMETTLPVTSVQEASNGEVHMASPEVREPASEVSAATSPAAAVHVAGPQVEAPAPVVEVPAPAVSPPLPELPPPSIAANLDHSLPPTPTTTARPLSMSSEVPSQSADTSSYAASVSGLTSGITTYAPSAASGVADEAALARASIVANPPTPHLAPMVMFPSKAANAPAVPPIQTQEVSKHRDGSPSKAKEGGQHVKSHSTTRRRETETFKLVRSPSGGMHSNGDVIMGMGEQWEVVESPSESPKRSKKKERSKSKEREGEEGEAPRSHRRHRSTNDHATGEQTAVRSTRTPSVDTARRVYGLDGAASSRMGSRSHSRQRRESDASYNAKAAAINGHSHSHHGHHDRHVSASARPTSDFQTSADLNAVRAKDAWEMDRLWKAQSMAYGPDGAAVVPTPPTILDGSRPSTLVSADGYGAGTIPSMTDLNLHRATTLPADTHGSNHTFYAVHGPSYTQAPIIPPPPIIYSSVPHAQPASSSPPRRRQVSRSFSDRVPFPIKDRSSDPPSLTRNYIVNPLPDPPRLSPYQASPLPPSLAVASLAGAGAGAPSQNYAQYAGVPTRY